ncbi:hypothetical protein [Sphaerisporangium dianthi]|uniref:ATP-binding protein n=1 Tax=Sphaerisporangium dianthi TaxID=1436120 RepID=A0ABV9CST0_9ACTN
MAFAPRTVGRPVRGRSAALGRHLLANVFEAGFEPRSEGIVLIDVPALKARFVRIE